MNFEMALLSVPDISVVMSVYNGEKYLNETIYSILSQEDVSFELILINDGSDDKSGEILDRYAARDNRIKLIQQENQGLTKSLIRGCNEAKGKYIARHDVGDLSRPQRMKLQKAALDSDEELVFVSCWTEFYGPELEFLYMGKGTGIATEPTFIVSENEEYGVLDEPTQHGSVMFRKESYTKVGGYRSEFYFGQDWDLWYRLAESGKFMIVNKPLYRARVFPGSISAANKKRQDLIARLSLEAFRKRRKGLPENKILIEASRIKPDNRHNTEINPAPWYYFIGECLRRNGDRRAINYLKKSLLNDPFFYKSWVRIIQTVFIPKKSVPLK